MLAHAWVNDPAMVEALLARVPGAGRAFIACQDPFLRKTVLRASPAAASLVDDLTHDVYVHLWGNEFRVLRQRSVLGAPADRFPAVGLGEELRIDTDGIGGGALYLNTDLVHLFAFARHPAANPGLQ
jgi:hypothetical protein